jgi:hypothetical protein
MMHRKFILLKRVTFLGVFTIPPDMQTYRQELRNLLRCIENLTNIVRSLCVLISKSLIGQVKSLWQLGVLLSKVEHCTYETSGTS